MPQRKKAVELKEFTFYGFNIKTKSRKKVTDKDYYSLIYRIYSEDVAIDIGGDKAMVLRLAWKPNITYKGKTYRIIYGKITRFTTIDGSNWYNKKTKEYQNVEIPLDVFPNAYETDFIFIPKAHRLFIKASSKISVPAVLAFLKGALEEVKVKPEDLVSVNVISSENEIKEIIDADLLTNLSVTVSYTNDDLGDEAQELMDEMLKKGKIGEATASFRPDANGTLDTSSKLILGLLELAKENGKAKATIVKAGQKKKINTEAYPEQQRINAVDDDQALREALLALVLSKWRNA